MGKTSVHNWGRNHSQPGVAFMSAVIQFLGYNPVPPSKKWADRLVQGRKAAGLSQRKSAKRIGVDMSSALSIVGPTAGGIVSGKHG